MDPWIGKTLGNCRLEKWVGEGAMGGVYEAYHTVMKKKVAVKLLHISSIIGEKADVNKKRFLREAHCASQLSHPNILTVYGIEEYQDTYYMVMEFIEGQSLLDAIIQKGHFSIAESLQISRKVALALQEAHSKNIIHRDIKPGNIMILPDGNIKLMDFGLARNNSDELNNISQTGEVVGTIFYLSPEQAMGAKKIDHRCDFYSLGVTLFQMLTGKLPFPGRTPIQVIEQHISAPVPDMRQWIDIPASVVALLEKLMAKKPSQRFSSAQDLILQIDLCEQSLESPNISSRNRLFIWDIFIKYFHQYTFYFSKQSKLTRFLATISGFILLFMLSLTIVFLLGDSKHNKNHEKILETNPNFSQPLTNSPILSLPTSVNILPQFFEIMPENHSKINQEKIEITGKIRGQILGVKVAGNPGICEKIAEDIYSFSGKVLLEEGNNSIRLEGILNDGNIISHQIWLERVSSYHNNIAQNKFTFSAKIINAKGEQIKNFQENQPIIIELSWIIHKPEKSKNIILNITAEGPANIIPIHKNLGVAKVERDSLRETLLLDQWLQGNYNVKASLSLGDFVQELYLNFTIEQTATQISKIEISPEKIQLFPGQTVIFQAKAYNIYNQEISFQPYWIVSGGISKNDGVYIAGNTPGDYVILVRDRTTWIQAQAIVQILSGKNVLGWFGEKIPNGMKRSEIFGEYIWEKDLSTMIFIPEGEFWFALYKGDKNFEQFFLPSFYIDKYELTWGQYLRFCKESNHPIPPAPAEFAIQQDHPVVNICWSDAIAYSKWAGKRIPTETEWEKAAKGGCYIPDWNLEHYPITLIINPYPKRFFPWGDSLPYEQGIFLCNYVALDQWEQRGKDGYIYTSRVGSFPQGCSPYRVHDMAGNVWEWCAEDPRYPSITPDKCITRGGSWVNFAASCRITRRDLIGNERWPWIGVRMAK